MADLSGVNLHLVDSVEMATKFMTWLSERRPEDALAVDTETGELKGNPTKDALSPWHGRLRLVQVGDGLTGWAIPWDGWNGVFHEAMRRYEGQLIFHNVAFEARWFALQSEFELPWHRAHDTMIQAHIVDPLGSGALKSLCSRYVDSRAAALQGGLDEAMAKHRWTWGTVPVNLKEYWAYGALDTVLTCRLWERFNDQCGPTGPYHQVYDLEMAVRRVVTQMELNGARVDLDYSEQKYKELHDYAESVKAWGREVFDGKSLSSTRDLVNIFENTLGAEITEYTPGGSKKCDKDQLRKLVIEYPNSRISDLAETVLRQRKAAKLAETYFLNFQKWAIDGVVHPDVRTLGARTGRMSIGNPALQTLNKGERVVRDAFIARNDDEVLLSSDLDQVEFRLFAAMSQDSQLIDLFKRADADAASGDPDGDAFTYIMRELYGDPKATKRDKRRKLIKGYIYSRLYGAGVAKQALTAGVPETQMRGIADAFDRSYPGARTFTQKVEDQGMRRQREEGQGYVVTSTGRRLPCDDGKVYALVNYLIQSTAAEIFKVNLLKLDAAGFTPHMVVPVHDEIVLSVPKKDAANLAPEIKECMTTRDDIWPVPLTADVSAPGERWGDLLD